MHIVYLNRRHITQEMFVSGRVMGERDILVKGKTRQIAVNLNEGNGLHDMGEVGTFLCTGRASETEAKEVATRLASMYPGDEVFVSKVETIVAGKPAEVVFKSVSEKGVLPV